jgi:hypothetical protein
MLLNSLRSERMGENFPRENLAAAKENVNLVQVTWDRLKDGIIHSSCYLRDAIT